MKEIKEWISSNHFCKAAAGTIVTEVSAIPQTSRREQPTSLQQKPNVMGVARRVGGCCKILECEALGLREFSQASNTLLRKAVLLKTELNLTNIGQMFCYTNPRLNGICFLSAGFVCWLLQHEPNLRHKIVLCWTLLPSSDNTGHAIGEESFCCKRFLCSQGKWSAEHWTMTEFNETEILIKLSLKISFD